MARLNLTLVQVSPTGFKILHAGTVIWPKLFKNDDRPRLTANEFLFMCGVIPCQGNTWGFRGRGDSFVVVVNKDQFSFRDGKTNFFIFRHRLRVVDGTV